MVWASRGASLCRGQRGSWTTQVHPAFTGVCQTHSAHPALIPSSCAWAADAAAVAAPRIVPSASEADVALVTPFGEVGLRLRAATSPVASRWLWDLAGRSECAQCRFYRAEPVPRGWANQSYFFGPPYALLQGSLRASSRGGGDAGLPKEAGCILQRGCSVHRP